MAKLVMYGFWNVGKHASEWDGKVKVLEKVVVGFYDVATEKTYSRMYTLSKHPKSNMVKELEVVNLEDAVGKFYDCEFVANDRGYFRITSVKRSTKGNPEVKVELSKVEPPQKLIDAMSSRSIK